MKSIFAKSHRSTGTNGLQESSRSEPGPSTKTDGDSTLKRVLLASLMGFSGLAQAQFCPQNFDSAGAPNLPAGWGTGVVSPWIRSTASPDTSPNAAFAANPAAITDSIMLSPATLVTAANSMFYFRHSYNTESTFDGGVLEISIDGGALTDIIAAGGSFSGGGYNATISTNFSSPIAGRMAWSGNSNGFITTGVTLPAAAIGHSVEVYWRAASDTSVGGIGWYVDSIGCGAPPSPPGSWTLAAPYPIPILDQAVTIIGNSLYSFGGVTANAATASAYRFDGNTWTAIASVPTELEWPVVASDGQYAYVIGGILGSGAATSAGYRYDPVANSYISIAPSPTATWASAAVYQNGKIYKIGGKKTGISTGATTAVEVYNIAANTWSTAAPYPAALAFSSAFASGSFIYNAGGVSDSTVASSKAYRYDPATDVWDDNAFADLPQTRWGAASARFHGTGIVAGGYANGVAASDITATAIQWNAQTNTWILRPSMLQAHARFAGGVVRGCFHAIGGRSETAGGFAGSTEAQKLDCVFYDGFEK